MKNLFLTFAVVVLISQLGFSQTIVGSGHDFSANAWANTEICLPCHTPHNAMVVSQSPLWNHELTASTFTVYDNTVSSTFDATTGQPDGNSKLCLSCHDGSVALENFGGTTTGTTYVTGNALLGTDLRNDHPISFTYDAALATTDGGVYNPTTQTSGLGSTINADMLFAGKMQCASCHDVHNGSGIAFLLRKSNTGSALCLTCHNK